MDEVHSTFEKILNEQGVLVYKNSGNSMMPLLRQHRDLLIIRPKPEGRLKQYDVAFYKRDKGQYILHRVLWVRKNDYVICGDNQYHPEFGISDKHILGVLDSVVRDGITYPLRSTPEHPHVSWKYILYVHIWCDFFVFRAPIVFLIKKYNRSQTRVSR